MSESDSVGRRGFIATVGVAAAAAGTVVGGSVAIGQTLSGGDPEAPREDTLLLGIGAGHVVGVYRVRAVHPERFGAMAVVLETADGHPFQVDVFRRDRSEGAVLGVGNSQSLSVFLSNGGDGRTATVEEEGLGAMALADALAAREAANATPPSELLTFRERGQRYPLAAYSVPLR